MAGLTLPVAAEAARVLAFDPDAEAEPPHPDEAS
jgi:hypothetical protein